MDARKLNRRVTFLARTAGARNGLNAAVPSWAEAGGTGQGGRWAQKIDARDAQRQASQRQAAQGVAEVLSCWFRVRRDAMTAARTAGDRIRFGVVAYDIVGVKDVEDAGPARDAMLEFTCVAAPSQ